MDRHYKSSSSELKRRSRSRSPINDRKDRKHYSSSHDDYKKRSRKSSSSSSSSDDDRRIKAAPPAPRISMNFSKSSALSKGNSSGIQIKLNAQPKNPVPVIQKSTKITNVFNEDDSEPEEMPAEAKMRMRNIGKDTPTSSGPNSFGKTKQGFIDTKKLFERKLKQMADEISND